MTKVLKPQRRMAIFVTNKESTHAKSQNHPESTLPIVLDIPEIVSISYRALTTNFDCSPKIEMRKFASFTATPLKTAMFGK